MTHEQLGRGTLENVKSALFQLEKLDVSSVFREDLGFEFLLADFQQFGHLLFAVRIVVQVKVRNVGHLRQCLL